MIFKKIGDYREMIELSALAFSFLKKDQADLEKLLKQLMEEDRIFYGVYDETVLVAGCVIYPFQMRLRESVVPMAGIGFVCSRQDYRGKGGVRLLLSETLRELKESAYPVSLLYPFNREFYRKYGWEVFDRWQQLSFSPSDIRVPVVEGVTSRDTAFPDEESISFYTDFAESNLNYVLRTITDWKDKLLPVWSNQAARRIVKFSRAGEVVGLMGYSINFNQKEGIYFHSVSTFISKDESARRAMFSYIKGLSHQVKKVKIYLPENFQIWPYINDRPELSELLETSMIRIVDLSRLDGLKVCSPDMTLGIKVEDKQCPWNAGTFTLQVRDGTLKVQRGGNAQIEIDIGPLSSVLGGRETFNRMIELGLAKPLQGYDGQDVTKSDLFMNEMF